MPSAADARAYNVSYTPPGAAGPPVAVVLGGTAGIGAGIASELAAGLKGELDVFLLGRNAAAARAVLDAMPAGRGRKREFVRCDATLMADVVRAAGEVRAQAEKVNYLVMSPGIMTLQGRTETAEGIDEKMALHYYARWKLAQELLPLMQRAHDGGEDAKLMSVLAPGYGSAIDLGDLGLRKKYSVTAAGLQMPSYNDCMIESLAARHPGLAFVHAHPGFVHTRLAATSNSRVLRMLAPLTGALAAFGAGQSPADCGARLTYALLRAGAGASRVTEKGEDAGTARLFTSADVNEKVWAHTVLETKSEGVV